MSEDKRTVAFKADARTRQEIIDYQEANGHETKSDAVHQLVSVGLREQKSQLLWRMKDHVVEWVGILAIAAIMVFLAGVVGVFAMDRAATFSVSLLGAALVLLSVFEAFRVVYGTSEMGAWVRQVVGGESA